MSEPLRIVPRSSPSSVRLSLLPCTGFFVRVIAHRASESDIETFDEVSFEGNIGWVSISISPVRKALAGTGNITYVLLPSID